MEAGTYLCEPLRTARFSVQNTSVAVRVLGELPRGHAFHYRYALAAAKTRAYWKQKPRASEAFSHASRCGTDNTFAGIPLHTR